MNILPRESYGPLIAEAYPTQPAPVASGIAREPRPPPRWIATRQNLPVKWTGRSPTSTPRNSFNRPRNSCSIRTYGVSSLRALQRVFLVRDRATCCLTTPHLHLFFRYFTIANTPRNEIKRLIRISNRSLYLIFRLSASTKREKVFIKLHYAQTSNILITTTQQSWKVTL